MNEQLVKLIEIQALDSQIDGLQKNIVKINNEIIASQELLKTEKSKIETARSNSTNISISKKEKEVEIDTLDSKIKKHTMELNVIKANDAYKALLTEIKDAQAAKLKMEDELLDMMEHEEKVALDIKHLQGECLKVESEVVSNVAQLELELKKIEEEISKIDAERKTKSENISKTIIAKYENIRKNKSGIAVVKVEDDKCGGCHRNLPIHIIDELKKSTELIFCSNCMRILYQK